MPRPVNQPVEIWQPLVSGNPRGVDFMAKMGIKPLISNNSDSVLADRMKLYRDAVKAHGHDKELGEDVAIGYRFFIADTQEKAMELARPYYEEAMKFAAPLGLTPLTPEQIGAVADPAHSRGVELPSLEQAVAGHGWLCGPAEMIIEHLQGVQEKFPGVERVNLGAVMGMPREVFKDQLTKFADQVMPSFSKTANGR